MYRAIDGSYYGIAVWFRNRCQETLFSKKFHSNSFHLNSGVLRCPRAREARRPCHSGTPGATMEPSLLCRIGSRGRIPGKDPKAGLPVPDYTASRWARNTNRRRTSSGRGWRSYAAINSSTRWRARWRMSGLVPSGAGLSWSMTAEGKCCSWRKACGFLFSLRSCSLQARQREHVDRQGNAA